jgi:dienelactone hydrolase
VPSWDREFLGHPLGLYFLSGTELWERISFHGMQALLAQMSALGRSGISMSAKYGQQDRISGRGISMPSVITRLRAFRVEPASSEQPRAWSYSPACLLLASAGALLAPSAVLGLGEPLFHFSESPGSHPVGLRVVEQYDRSRTFQYRVDELGKPYQGERARPVQTLIWYPAYGTKGKPMTMADYVSLMRTEINFNHPRLPVKAMEWSSALGLTLTMSLRAVRDAPLAPGSGHFPIVIYAPGANDPAWENLDLCEYLASYGYIVIASPSLGAKSHRMTIDIGGANAQATDISFLIGYAKTLPDANTSKIAVVGMSWGGLANLFAAARDSRISALVSLDGSMRYFPHIVEEAGDVHPEQMAIPLLAFAERDWSIEDSDHYLSSKNRAAPNVLNRWTHGDLIVVHMMSLSHAAFTSLYQRSEDFWWELAQVYPLRQADYGRADTMAGYGWVARYTLRFLDAYLKNDVSAMEFLKRSPAENQVPSHVMAVTYRAGSGSPVSFESFRAEIGRQGFDHAPEIYADFHERDSKFELDEGLMTDWSDELLSDSHPSESLILLKLNLQLHPDSSNAYLQLGTAYELLGQAQTAIENYREAVTTDPLNGGARRKLMELSTHEGLPKR